MFETPSGTYAHRVKILPHYSVGYVENITSSFRNCKPPEGNRSHGVLSKKAISRMSAALNWMMLFSTPKKVYSISKKKSFTFKLNFITLTLSTRQKHSDQYILHKMLFPFLKWLERKYQVTAYVWRAEIQPKRLKEKDERCIHFHVTLDRFVHWRAIRNKWNSLQRKHGYTEPTADPNSTDVHSVRSEKKIVGYFTKYMTKKVPDESLKVTCKIFGMSRNLSQMNLTLKEELHPMMSDELQWFFSRYKVGERLLSHAKLHFTKFQRTDELPTEIERMMLTLYDSYSLGIESPTHIEIE